MDLIPACSPVDSGPLSVQGDVPDKLCIFHADENYMEIHDVFSTLAKSVPKEEKKENPVPKHTIQTMNRTPGCPALMNWDGGLYNKLEAAV